MRLLVSITALLASTTSGRADQRRVRVCEIGQHPKLDENKIVTVTSRICC